MRFLATISGLLAFGVATTSALNITNQYFVLQTQTSAKAKASFNNLVLQGGGVTPAFSSNRVPAGRFYRLINSTAGGNHLQWHDTEDYNAGTTYWLNLLEILDEAIWQPSTFAVAGGNDTNLNSGFYFNGTELLWTSDATATAISKEPVGFKGWLACNWWYFGEAQLFYLTSNYYSFSFVPKDCAVVKLKAIPIEP